MVNATRNERDRLKAAHADERRRLKAKISALKEANQKLEKKVERLSKRISKNNNRKKPQRK